MVKQTKNDNETVALAEHKVSLDLATESEAPQSNPRLHRSESNRIIGGVAGGLGEYFHIEPLLIRIAFVLLAFKSGIGFLIYLILWVVLPEGNKKGTILTSSSTTAQEMKHNIPTVAREMQPASDRNRFVIGIGIIMLGLYWLLENLGITWSVDIDRVWPIFLIAIGIWLLLRRR